MKILTSIFGGSGLSTVRNQAQRRDRELGTDQLYELLWAYYYNNGLYDGLREAGYLMDNAQLKEIYNPATRAVEFYVDTVWPGTLAKAHPIQFDGKDNKELREAIELLWAWSNWQARKQIAVRWAAVTGNVYLRVARPMPRIMGQPAPERVYIQIVRPSHVTYTEVDERDYLIYCRLDVPVEWREGRETKYSWHTEVWTPERLQVWPKNDHGSARHEDDLPQPEHEVDLKKEWGIDFVPIVHAKHIDTGEDQGIGAYTLQLSKINELNKIATRLHQMMYRHNDVTWALESNMMDATGRPIPAPRLSSSDNPGTATDTVELGGETMVRLPGLSKLAPLVPTLDYANHLATVQAQMEEVERDLPELSYYKLKDLPEMSGKALRILLMPALAKALEVRGNMEAALIRAHKMALTIGSEIGAFKGLGSFEAGALDHSFAERPVIGLTRQEVAELAAAEVGAGIPLVTSLRLSGWTQEDLNQLEEDKEAETSSQQMSLASALLSAQDQLGGPATGAGVAPEEAMAPEQATPEGFVSS